jgi:ribonuclease HI
MKFQATIEALQQLPKKSTITLFSDSRILVDAATKKERPTRFKEQLEQLDVLSKKHTINWKWVKAHSGIRHNERCDELCIQARI